MRGTCAFGLLVAVLAAVAPGQDDMRDVVHLKNGKEVRGRIAQPFAPGELLVVQGGKRVRVPRADIATVEPVSDTIREFLDRRHRLAGNPRAQWILVEWATARSLVNFAHLQAMQLALESDDERAHSHLGHRQRNKQWLWEHDGKWLTKEQLLTAIVRDQVVLPGERFRVRSDGDLGAAIAALFDLEQLGVWWFDTFGADLQFQEILAPVEVFAHRDATSFPKWGFRPLPYYVPDPHGDVAHTFYAGAGPLRPRLLFYVGSQGLLYRTMIGSVTTRDERDRVCPWLEVGLPMLAEQTFAGDPGHAVAGDVRNQDLQALQALSRDYQLQQLLHLPMYGGFYLMDDTPTATNWSAATMFAQYLLRPDNVPNTRAAFLSYVRQSLGEKRGDSSSLFDAVMGRRIEDFDEPFRRWLEKVATK